MRALVVDSAQGRGSLAAVRALARAGWTVGVGAPTRVGLPMLSRFTRHRHLVPGHASGSDEFLNAINRAIAMHDYEVVFACSDSEILTLSRERGKVHARVPHPPHDAMLRAIDKVDLGAAARAIGMATPPEAASAAEGRERWGNGPVIVKERLHGTQTASGAFTNFAPEAFTDAVAVDRRIREIQAAEGNPLVQPLIEGQLTAFTSVLDEHGNMLARVQQVAERTYPRGAGLSVRARTVRIDERLGEQVTLLLREIGWFGLSELQFIAPRAGKGDPVLLDLNGRFYGSLALALAAGVNLPDTWACSATGRRPQHGGDARSGVRYQWLEGDLRAARERSAGPTGDVCGCLRYARSANPSIWSATDPLPGLLAARRVLSQATRVAIKGIEQSAGAAEPRPPAR
jgi:predicted ATP-grasp superfamily ATP-dependent carboligase